MSASPHPDGRSEGRKRSMSQAIIRKRLLRSASEDRPKEMGKSTTATSFRPKLDRLLQDGKIEQIMSTDPHSKANFFYTTHVNELEKELGSTKKSLSTMVMKSKAKEYNINKLKSDIAKIEREQVLLQEDSQLNRHRLSDVKDRLARKKDDLEERHWTEKCYKNMKAQLDHDTNFLHTRQARRHERVGQLEKEKKELEGQWQKLCELQKKLEHSLGRAKQISKEEMEEKNELMELLNMEMGEKEMLNQLKVGKNEREHEINGLAVSVIEKEELQKYLQILFTHKVVSQIVRNKSQKLIEEYSQVQKAFLHIRSNTNISEMSRVLLRMENQDKEYESLLTKVTLLENHLLGMHRHFLQARAKEHHILSRDPVDPPPPRQPLHYQGIDRDNYQILLLEKEKLKGHSREDYILRKKIHLWAKEHSALFGLPFKAASEEEFLESLRALGGAIGHKIK